VSVWLAAAALIEGVALVAFLHVWWTQRTRGAFVAAFSVMLPVAGVYLLSAPPWGARDALAMSMVAVYVLRMDWVLLRWGGQTAVPKLDRKTPSRERTLLPILLVNVVGWGYCLPFHFVALRSGPLRWWELTAGGIYLVGTILHFGSDYQKHRFKKRPGSHGRILDTGFWASSRHPNYFGDFLIYVSYGLLGGNAWGWISPLLNLLQYLFDAIPKNERWAAERYGAAWQAYCENTARFVPFVG
jgi:steroid 5-alpha reductase family enzyme